MDAPYWCEALRLVKVGGAKLHADMGFPGTTWDQDVRKTDGD